jgi:hypothetical protein
MEREIGVLQVGMGCNITETKEPSETVDHARTSAIGDHPETEKTTAGR